MDSSYMGHGRGNYAGQGWAQVGQLDLTWTNIGPKELCLGLTIQVKVLGHLMLEMKTLFGDQITCILREKSTSEVF